MNARRSEGRLSSGAAVVASLAAVLVAGVLLPWWLADAGVRWSALQVTLVAGAAVAIAVVVIGRYSRRIGGLGRKRVRVAMMTLFALVLATAMLVALRVRVDQLRGELRDATMSVVDDGSVLRVEGYIADDFVADLKAHLARSPDLRRIDITSAGGLVDDALFAADLIRARSLRVRAVDQCASACVLLWAAANSREMHVDAQIGLHRAWVDPETPEGMKYRVGAEYEARSLAVLQAAGFSEELLDRRAGTANEDMTWFDAAELLDHGLHMTVVDDDGTLLTDRRVRQRLGRREGAGAAR